MIARPSSIDRKSGFNWDQLNRQLNNHFATTYPQFAIISNTIIAFKHHFCLQNNFEKKSKTLSLYLKRRYGIYGRIIHGDKIRHHFINVFVLNSQINTLFTRNVSLQIFLKNYLIFFFYCYVFYLVNWNIYLVYGNMSYRGHWLFKKKKKTFASQCFFCQNCCVVLLVLQNEL